MSGNPSASPMMAQYLAIKAEHGDALLFYRMGDFYEMFFDDAALAASALGIALTKRGQHLGQDIPMCGVPVHSAESYLQTLIRKGFRVAVCEQTEDPAEAKKRGSKSVVSREVVRLVTPGTLTEDSLLEPGRHNFLAAYAEIRGEGAFAWVDVSTCEVTVAMCSRPQFSTMLARLAPSEVLVSETEAGELQSRIKEAGAATTPLARASFESVRAKARVEAAYGVRSLEGFGEFGRPEIAALGALCDYLDLTQRGNIPALRPPARETPGGTMQIDPATRRNLELGRSLSGERNGSLVAAIDRTMSSAGARLLETRLMAPSTQRALIVARHDAVSAFRSAAEMARDIRAMLRQVPDIERALSRLGLDRGSPRDLAAIRDALAQASRIRQRLNGDLPEILAAASDALAGHESLVTLLDAALVVEPSPSTREGGFIAASFDPELDETRQLRDEGRSVIAKLQSDYIHLSGINALKIRHNNVLGYFIETPATYVEKMSKPPLGETFVHRQTTASAVRFTTLALTEIEKKILNAADHAVEIEKGIFARLRSAVVARTGPIGATAHALAEIDVSAALADLALSADWVRPEIEESRAFEIRGGRHPVVEQALKQTGGNFIANDCEMSADVPGAQPLWLVTGPNMAGKSTFLRQNAIIALLAQMGAFVPAERARIGIVDQLFSRVGAADDLARGRSTFMVEMVETAAILNQAGEGALVILDEIGRGTATYDGLSIAWATLEHLHDVNSLPDAVCHALPRVDRACIQTPGDATTRPWLRYGNGMAM